MHFTIVGSKAATRLTLVMLLIALVLPHYAYAFTNGQAAVTVIGQTGFTSSAGAGGGCGGTASARTLCNPFGIAFDSSGNLWVSDVGNNRVLGYSTVIASTTLVTGVDAGSGSVSPVCPSPNGCSENVGSPVMVTATPSPGWQFSSWSTQTGISCPNTSQCTFTMPNNAVTLGATFTHASTPPSTNFTLNTASACLQLGGSNPYGDFCDISGLTIPSGYSVTITKAGGDGTLTSMGFTGTNVNYGTINTDSSVGTGTDIDKGYSTLNNYGTINIGLAMGHNHDLSSCSPPRYLFINSGGTINNYGTINNNCGMLSEGFNNGFGLISEGILNNYGTFNNNVGLGNAAIFEGNVATPGTINNYPAGIFNNYGSVVLYPGSVFGNQGTVNDYCGATFQGTGTFTGNPAISLCTPSTQVSPNPSSVIIGNTITYTVTVTGLGPTPTGTVTWSAASGSFSGGGSCTLSSGSCTVTYTPSPSPGPVTITATYGGDSNYAASSGTSSLTVLTFTYDLWVTVEPTGAGTVALSPAGSACPTIPVGVTNCAVYTTPLAPPGGPTVSFTATPAAGYYFVGWALNGSYLSTGIPANNPDTWVMNASYALTAYFQQQNQWVRYPGNPVLTASANPTAWDNSVVWDPKPFLFPNGTFGMAYDGYNTGGQIGLATSPDGRTWTRESNIANNGPILLRGSPGQWDEHSIKPGSIFYDSSRGQYLLYYSARASGAVCGIGLAYSTDAITWTKSPNNPFINTNDVQGCHGLSSPSVIKVGGTYTMWYARGDGVHIATSTTADANWNNGTNNNNGGQPVFTPACSTYSGPGTWCYGADPVLAPGPWDSDSVYGATVVYDSAANNFKMFYSATDGSSESAFTNGYGSVSRTGFATSPDGVNWTRYPGNPIIAPVPGFWDNGDSTDFSGVLLVNGQLLVYYSGDTFTAQSCLESGSSSAPGTGTCPVSTNAWFGAIPSHFVTYSIGLLYPFGSNVAGVATATGIGTATFATSAGGFSSLTAPSVSSISPPPPAGLTFPDGLFSFTIVGLSANQPVTVTITLPAPLPTGSYSYWKLQAGMWSQCPSGACQSASLDSTRTIVTLTLTADSTGIINDPGGPATFTNPSCPAATVNLKGANLKGDNFEYCSLAGRDLSGSNLQNADFLGANLQGANLQGANLQGANLQYANLQNALLQGANLQGDNLQGANLARANLQGDNLQGANLAGANLNGDNLQGANLQRANMNNDDLTNANFTGANCQRSTDTGATTTGVITVGSNSCP